MIERDALPFPSCAWCDTTGTLRFDLSQGPAASRLSGCRLVATILTAPSPRLSFDPELIRKYDGLGPRYTSYPTADRFSEAFTAEHLANALLGRFAQRVPQPQRPASARTAQLARTVANPGEPHVESAASRRRIRQRLARTKALVKTLPWYKGPPQIDLLAVHLQVPRLPNMSVVVSKQMIERYYAEESAAMLAPSRRILDAAKVKYTVHTVVGPIAETIIDQAKQSGSNMICMGTRGMTPLSNMMLGSVAARVLHLAHVPVVLIH